MEKSSNAASRSEQSSALVEVDPGEVHVCDLRGKGLQVEDLENALRLWRQPVVLMAGRNWLNRLPTNTPSSIMYLDISTNKLTSLEGFSALPSVRELDVSHNDIRSMLGLVSNTNLRVLRISHNCIRRIEGLHQQKLLEEIDLSHNLLNTAADVRALSLNPAMRRLRMEGNPFCATGVQNGSYVIAMQYLLPGMSLLDGKILRGPSSLRSPPSPPPVRRTLDHGVGGPIQPTLALEGGIAACDSPGDVSISRKWRDMAIAPGREPPPIPEREQGGRTPVGIMGKTRAKRGCGGPTVDSGSYLDFFLFGLRRKRRAASTSPAAAAAATTTAAGKRRVNSETHPRRRVEGMRAVNTVPASPGQRTAGGRRAGDRGTDEIGVCVRGTRGAIYATPLSPSSYRSLTRAERVKARSLALKQAREEDALGRASNRTGASGVKKSAGPRSPRAARSPGTRPDADSRLSPRDLTSPWRRKNNGISAETSRPWKSQALAAGKRTRRVPSKKEGNSGCTSSAGMASQNSTTSKVKKSRHLGIRTRAHDTSPGARRFTNSTRQPDSHAFDSWNSSNHAPPPVTRERDARRSGGFATARSRSSGRQGTAKVRNVSAAPTGRRGRATHHRFRVTLGHRSRCAPWLKAPRASRCTPREDAKPRPERTSNWRGTSTCERATNDESEDLSRWCSGQGVWATPTPRRDESSGRRIFISKDQEGTDPYPHYASNNDCNCYDGVDDVGDDSYGSGTGDYHCPDRRSWATTPFVSPLSKTGLMRRRSWPRYPGTSLSTVLGARSAGVAAGVATEAAAAAASCERWSAASRTHPQVNVNQEWPKENLVERSSSSRGLSKDSRRVKLDEGSTAGSLRYNVDDASHTPKDLLDKGGKAKHGSWGRGNEPLATSPISFAISRISRENTRRAVNDPGREPHGKSTTSIPERSEVVDSAHDSSPELSDWSRGGHNDHTGRQIEQTTVSSQWQQHYAERQGGQRPSPPVQLVTLGSTSAPVKNKKMCYTRNTQGSGKCDLHDAASSGTARKHSCRKSGSLVSDRRIRCDGIGGKVDDANKKEEEEDDGEKEAFCLEGGDLAHRQRGRKKCGQASSLDAGARNAIARLDDGQCERTSQNACSPGVKIDKEEDVRRDDPEVLICEAGRALSEERGPDRTERSAEASKKLAEDELSMGSAGAAGQESGQTRSQKAKEEHTEKAGHEAVTLARLENEMKKILAATMKEKGGDMSACSPAKSVASDPGPRYDFDKEEVRRDDSDPVIREAGSALSKEREPHQTGRRAEACKALAKDVLSMGSTTAAGQESRRDGSKQAQKGQTEKAGHEAVTFASLENEVMEVLAAVVRERGGDMSADSTTKSDASDPGQRHAFDKEEVRRDDFETVIREAEGASSKEREPDQEGRPAEACKELVEERPPMGSATAADEESRRDGSQQAQEGHTEKAGQETVTLASLESEVMEVLGSIVREKGGDMSACSQAKFVASDPGPRYAVDKEEVWRDDPEPVTRQAGRAMSEERGPERTERPAEACMELAHERLSTGSATSAGQESRRPRSQQAQDGHTEMVGHENITLVGFEKEVMETLGSVIRGRGVNMSAGSPMNSVASDLGPRHVIDKEEVPRDDPEPVVHEAGNTSSEREGRPAEAWKEFAEEELPMGSAATAAGQESGWAGSQQAQEGHTGNAGGEIVTLARLENEIMEVLGSLIGRRGGNTSACSPMKSVTSDPWLR